MRKTATLVVVVALTLVGALFLANAAKAGTAYSDVPAWDGQSYVWSWGLDQNEDTSTYGEVIPGNGQELSSFTFYLKVNPAIVFKAVVATWDGEKAGTALYTSSDMTAGGDGESFTPVTVILPQGITLQSGQQYVLYFTTVMSEQSVDGIEGDNLGQWGAIPLTNNNEDVQAQVVAQADPFPDGYYVYDNVADPASLFLEAWDGGQEDGYASSHELVLVAHFGSPVSPQVDNVNACANGNAYRAADGSYGLFVTIAESQFNTGKWTDAQGATWTVTPSNFMKGIGATCDNPQSYGYVYSGYDVSGDGTVNEIAPQFNIYPYWIPASEAPTK